MSECAREEGDGDDGDGGDGGDGGAGEESGVSGQASTACSKWSATVSGSSSCEARWCKSNGGTALSGFGCVPAFVAARCGRLLERF